MKKEEEDFYYYKTTSQIDAKLCHDTLEQEDNIFKWTIIILLGLIFIFRGWIGYWLNFGFPIPSKADFKQISVAEDPIQKDYTDDESKKKTFVYKSLINDKKITFIPKASYKLSGLVVAHNHQFLFPYGYFDSAALYDLGAAWGQMGDKEFYDKYFRSYSAKTEMTGSRILWTEFKRKAPVDQKYATTHWSHSHLVPANKNIMAALLHIKTWDKVEIEGELIDMEYKNYKGDLYKYYTSMSRDDVSPYGDRGNGSCETIYVTKVKRGNWIYK